MRYRANLTIGSLRVPESRIIADLLLRDLDKKSWKKAICDDNILQARSIQTAMRVAQFLRNRLEQMDADFWKLIKNGSLIVATHSCLATAIKHSYLLGDFLNLVIREQYRIFSPKLSLKIWENYLEECQGRDPAMCLWSHSTRDRLRSSVFQILAQTGYIENTKSLKLQSIQIASEVLDYLHKNNERYVLRCIQVSS